MPPTLHSLRFLSAVCLLACVSACGCPDTEEFIHIGEFDSREAALRAAIPRLAVAIGECPKVQKYRIVFTAPGIYAIDRHALLYWRRGSKADIGYEDDVFSGIWPGFGPYEVDDAFVLEVSRKGGSLADFDRASK